MPRASTAVRLPGLPNRGSQRGFCTLVKSIPSAAIGAWEIQGKFLAPGQAIAEAELWPGAGYPQTPLLIENAGPARKPPGRTGSVAVSPAGDVYRVWTYDAAAGEWDQRAEVVVADASDWVATLKPVLVQTYQDCCAPRPVITPSDALHRLRQAIDSEISHLAQADRLAVLSGLHQHLASLSVKASAKGA